MSEATAETTPRSASGRRLRLSPVTRQELTDRFRGNRGSLVVTGYVALLALALLLLYLVMASIARFDGSASHAAVGRSMFDSFMAIQLGVVMFFGAGYAASQVANEREKRTLPLLQITSLTPFGIVAGKWWAVAAWQVLLLVLGMPLAAAAAFFGGVTMVDVGLATLYMIVVVCSFSAVAIAISATMRRTTTAIIVTYGLLAALMIGPVVLAIVEYLITEDVPQVSMFFHPLTGLAFAAGTPTAISLPTLLTPFRIVYAPQQFGLDVAGGVVEEAGRQGQPVVALLVSQLTIAVLVGVIALRLAARRVTPGRGPRRRAARRRDDTDDGPRGSGAPPTAPASVDPPGVRAAEVPAPPPPPPAPPSSP